MKFSRMAQDSILYEMSVMQDEIIRLKTKLNNEATLPVLQDFGRI